MTKVSRKGSDAAAREAAMVKHALDKAISAIVENPAEFVADPSRDFARKRTLPLERMLRIILGMGGNSLQKEISDYFEGSKEFATKSAFVQQRSKIKPEALKYMLHQFNHACHDSRTYMGYHLYACDGTKVTVATDLDNADTHVRGGSNSDGFNQYHISAFYDLMNKTYVDAIVKGVNSTDEPQAAVDMVNSLDFPEKSILICDRGYTAMNLMEHCNRKDGLDYLIRVKERGWIKEVSSLPMEDLDIDISFELRTTQTNEDKVAYKNGTAKFINGKSKFGKNKISQTWDFESPHQMTIRIVRFRITEDRYETIATSLNRFAFPAERIKELYNMRWGIETSFRDLKYAIGMVNFHARKGNSILQEIYAALVMYNFSERLTSCAVVVKAKGCKHIYQVNFAMSAYSCKKFFRERIATTIALLTEILRYVEPVREGRSDKRKMKTQSAVNFIYRVA